MANRHEIRVSYLDAVTPDLFREAILLAYSGGITSIAPLGRSGDTIILYDAPKGKKYPDGNIVTRPSQISVRNYCGDAELLITDEMGNFLFYGRYHINLGFDFVVDEYYRIFEKVKDRILGDLKERNNITSVISENAQKTEGFGMLSAYDAIKKQFN